MINTNSIGMLTQFEIFGFRIISMILLIIHEIYICDYTSLFRNTICKKYYKKHKIMFQLLEGLTWGESRQMDI